LLLGMHLPLPLVCRVQKETGVIRKGGDDGQSIVCRTAYSSPVRCLAMIYDIVTKKIDSVSYDIYIYISYVPLLAIKGTHTERMRQCIDLENK